MSTDNTFLRKKILNLFKVHTEIDSSSVDVDIDHDVVTLSGKVDGSNARATLEGLARTLTGDKEIINNLELDSDNLSGVQGLHL